MEKEIIINDENARDIVSHKDLECIMAQQKEYVPNHVYKFQVTPLVDIPRIIVPVDRVDWNTDAFGNDEDNVQEAYFTKERINELKRKYIKMIEETENPFDIYCVDTDGDYAFTDEEIFRP